MKYPTRITLELKKNKRTRAFFLDTYREYIGLKVFINFKQHDARSGINYKIGEVLNYTDEIEIKLIRADYKDE